MGIEDIENNEIEIVEGKLQPFANVFTIETHEREPGEEPILYFPSPICPHEIIEELEGKLVIAQIRDRRFISITEKPEKDISH